MESQIHMKKFFEDIYHDSTMYSCYLNGQMFLNMDLYTKWYKEMRLKRDLFLKELKSTSMFKIKHSFFETSIHEDFLVTEKVFGEKIFEVKEFTLPDIFEYPLGGSNLHYICNGCYESTLENIFNVLNKGSFTVGICTDKKSVEYKQIVKYYNELKDFLMRRGYHASSFECNNGGSNKTYLLMYDSLKQKKK